MEIIYYAIFQYDDDGICISFPDIPPCLTCSQDENEGIEMAMEALELYLHGMKLEEIPKAIFNDSSAVKMNQKVKQIKVEMEMKRGHLFSKGEVIMP